MWKGKGYGMMMTIGYGNEAERVAALGSRVWLRRNAVIL